LEIGHDMKIASSRRTMEIDPNMVEIGHNMVKYDANTNMKKGHNMGEYDGNRS